MMRELNSGMGSWYRAEALLDALMLASVVRDAGKLWLTTMGGLKLYFSSAFVNGMLGRPGFFSPGVVLFGPSFSFGASALHESTDAPGPSEMHRPQPYWGDLFVDGYWSGGLHIARASFKPCNPRLHNES